MSIATYINDDLAAQWKSKKKLLVRLTLESRAVHYDVSLTPVRTAVAELIDKGLLKKGLFYRVAATDQVGNESRTRPELKLTWPKLEADQLQRMLELNRFPATTGDSQHNKSLNVDESIHVYLISTAGHTYIKDFFDRQGRYYHLLFAWEGHDHNVAIETMGQNREILTALIKKKWTAAIKTLSNHVLDNHPILGKFNRLPGKRGKKMARKGDD